MRILGVVTQVLFLVGFLAAQEPLMPEPMSAPVSVNIDSEVVFNASMDTTVAWSEVITIPFASSVQLAFDTAMLESDEDRIVVTSTLDGERHEMDRLALKQWSQHTAWLNGPQVVIEVRLAPGSSGHVALTRVNTGNPAPRQDGNPGPCSYCAAGDPRVASTDPRVARLVAGGTCTGWLIDHQSTMLSAAHCGVAFGVAQFNVPASSSTGALIAPPVADQYPINLSTLLTSGPTFSLPNDWAVMRLGNNSSGQSASSRQGWFNLANSPPAAGVLMRGTGFGVDATPTCVTNATNQTSTGVFTSLSNNSIFSDVQVQSGNSGGPMIDTTTGLAVGIATVCTGGTTGCGTGGVFVTYPPLAAAIATTTGCPVMNLANNVPQVTCGVMSLFNLFPPQPIFNVVGISSTGDWDLQLGTASSAAGAGEADFLIADARLGTPAPLNGTAFLFQGASPPAQAVVHAQSAAALQLDQAATYNWNNLDVVRCFDLTITQAGTYRVTVLGDPQLRFRIFPPATNAAWRTPGAAIATGTAGASALVVSLSAGQHALVVSRNNATLALANPLTTVHVSSLTPLPLASNVPQTTPLAARTLTCTPAPGVWNVIGVGGAASWAFANGNTTSFEGGGTSNHFVANGHLGTIPATNALAFRFEGSGTGTLEHESATAWNLSDVASRTLPAGHALTLLEFNITTAGLYDVGVDGDPTLEWFLYSPGSGTPIWKDPLTRVRSGQVGGFTQTGLSLGTGFHALVVAGIGAPSASPRSFVPHVCAAAAVLPVPANSSATTISTPCQPFSITPVNNFWNVVGIHSASDWDVSIGGQASIFGSGNTDFLVADGNSGTISPSNGLFQRFSGLGSALANHKGAVAFISSPIAATLASGDAVGMWELSVPSSPGLRDVSVTGTAGFQWAIFKKQTGSGSAAWRPRNTAFGGDRAVGSNALVNEPFDAGFHALVIFRGSATGSGSFTINFTPSPNPAPTLASISPQSVVVNSPTTTITVNGGSFMASTVVRLNGAPLATTFVSASQLTAVIPAASLTTAAVLPITVFTPTPGGGTAGGVNFTILNTAPVVLSLSPATLTATASAASVTVTGSGFVATSVVRMNGTPVSTTFQSSTQLNATLGAGSIANPGTYVITVETPAPGGGASGILSLSVVFPVPSLTSLAPATIVAGSPTTSFNVNGSGFFSSSIVRWNGSNITTSFISATQLSATVSSSLLATPGTATVTVFNPSPGGGTSGGQSMSLTSPTITSLTPGSIGVQPSGPGTLAVVVNGTNFLTTSVIHFNGIAAPTTFASSTVLFGTLNPATVLQATRAGGITVNVANSVNAVSNTVVLGVGNPPPSNLGSIRRQPLAPPLGGAYSALLEGCAPNQLFSLYVDLANVPPLLQFPDVVANFALNVTPIASPGPFFAIVEGLGLFGPATPIPLSAQGSFVLPGLVLPNPAANVDITLQAAYLDPSAVYGFRISHARWPDSL